MTIRPRRSALYMPGSNARALEKARSLPADVLIFDLEDAVAPALKAQARAQVLAALREGGYGSREVVVRVNGDSTPWGRARMRCCCRRLAPPATSCGPPGSCEKPAPPTACRSGP